MGWYLHPGSGHGVQENQGGHQGPSQDAILHLPETEQECHTEGKHVQPWERGGLVAGLPRVPADQQDSSGFMQWVKVSQPQEPHKGPPPGDPGAGTADRPRQPRDVPEARNPSLPGLSCLETCGPSWPLPSGRCRLVGTLWTWSRVLRKAEGLKEALFPAAPTASGSDGSQNQANLPAPACQRGSWKRVGASPTASQQTGHTHVPHATASGQSWHRTGGPRP